MPWARIVLTRRAPWLNTPMNDGNAGTGADRDAGTDKRDRLERRVETWSAVLLAIATVATAWSAFQAAKWSGVQAIKFSEAASARTESTRDSTATGQEVVIDVTLFTAWLESTTEGRDAAANAISERFPDDLKTAFEAWLALDPLNNPDAPSTPFELDNYTLLDFDSALELAAEAEDAVEAARDANQQSDDYVLMTVLFASVLFFAGIGTKFERVSLKVGTTAVGTVILVISAIVVATFPVEI